jgi:hypothetical protein
MHVFGLKMEHYGVWPWQIVTIQSLELADNKDPTFGQNQPIEPVKPTIPDPHKLKKTRPTFLTIVTPPKD